jgi:hypothetical protein
MTSPFTVLRALVRRPAQAALQGLRTLRLVLLAGLAGLVLAGCAGQQLNEYASEKPTLDLSQYFNGKLIAHGMFQDRSGQVVRRFVVDMEGTWNGNQGVLDERFTYSDGTTERRVWRLTKHENGRYTGTADDVEGEASGQTVGNAFRWGYTLRLPVDGKVYEVQFDDWMYLIDDKVMLNRATMSKFGIRLGEVTLSFTRLP